MAELFDYFPQPLRVILTRIPQKNREELEEIRFRVNRDIQITLSSGVFYADKQGKLSPHPTNSFLIEGKHLENCLEQFTSSSLYAHEHQLSQGYLTLEGGHRVGFCGTCTVTEGRVTGIRNISSINIRTAKEMIGISNKLMPRLVQGEQIKNTLIISPPGCGKTTLLRDICRNLSNGFESFSGTDIGVADERGELGAVYRGIPGNDLGIRTDISDNCPKAEGMIMLLRTMSPKVLITDEIGTKEDEQAIRKAMLSGVNVVCSVHGSDSDDIFKRMPRLANLFQLFITLEKANGIHQIRSVRTRD